MKTEYSELYFKLIHDCEEELKKIEKLDEADIFLNPHNKKCIFLLGMLFVNGIKIKIINESDFDFDDKAKSFKMMAYVWSRLSDNHFPLPNYSNVKTEMDNRIENFKRLGVRVNNIIDNPKENKIFLICPVRNANGEQVRWIEDFVKDKEHEGYIIHAPHLHTRQNDLLAGYAVCRQNAEAVASASEVDIYYDRSSTGSVFDLGVAYALHKPLKLLNEDEIELDDDFFVDQLIKSWPYNDKAKVKNKNWGF